MVLAMLLLVWMGWVGGEHRGHVSFAFVYFDAHFASLWLGACTALSGGTRPEPRLSSGRADHSEAEGVNEKRA
jgi:hypothetical protein